MMNRHSQFTDLAQRLAGARARHNWHAVAHIDRTLASTLPQLVAQGALAASERDALASLREAHSQALTQCACESARLNEVLATLREHKDGWLAYAAGGALPVGEAA